LRIIVAPDSFKGSLAALAVANAMEQGILSVFPGAEVIKVPIADGGEGTVEALVTATGGRIIRQNVMGPLGDELEAYWGILGDGETAVIEMAAASGLPLVPKEKRDPRITTTYGTGQLIKAVLDAGMRKIIIGIGGSATNDGGAGMAKALGAKFLDATGKELPNGGAALADLDRIDLVWIDPRLVKTEILVACDVDNPLCGLRGASAVYGPQKGATTAMVAELDQALEKFASVAKVATGKSVAECAGAGAAGGLGAGLLFFTNAQLRPGVQIVLEATGFNNIVKEADLVITGEGCTDFQTAHGKAPVGVAKIAKQFNVPVVCLSGGLGRGCETVLLQGIDGLMSILPQPMTLDECMGCAAELVQASTIRLCRLIDIGMGMSTAK
jgi:glycerate 2-kinase